MKKKIIFLIGIQYQKKMTKEFPFLDPQKKIHGKNFYLPEIIF